MWGFWGGVWTEAVALIKFLKAANCVSFIFHGHRGQFAEGELIRCQRVCVAFLNHGHVKLPFASSSVIRPP